MGMAVTYMILLQVPCIDLGIVRISTLFELASSMKQATFFYFNYHNIHSFCFIPYFSKIKFISIERKNDPLVLSKTS